MSRRRGKIGIKWFDGNIYDIAYYMETTNGFVWGAIGDNLHVTMLNEPEKLSSHITNQSTDDHQSISRISKSLLTSDKVAKAFFKPRPIRKSEHNEEVVYFTQRLADAINTISESLMKEVQGEKGHIYLDMPSIFEKAKDLLTEIQGNPTEYLGICKIHNLLYHDDRVGITPTYRVILKIDDQLWELNLPLPYPYKSDNKILNEMINFTGYSFLAERFMSRFNNLPIS